MKKFSLLFPLIIFVVGLVVGFGFYFTGPQKVYLETSEAIKNDNYQALSALIDCESLKKNFLQGVLSEGENSIDCNNFDLNKSLNQTQDSEDSEESNELINSIDDKYLAKNILDAYTNGYLVRKGENYEWQIEVEGGDSEYETELTFVYSKIGNSWKITDIELGEIETLIKAFTGFSDSLNEVDKEYELTLGQDLDNNNSIKRVVEIDTVSELSGEDFVGEKINIKAAEGKQFLRVLTRRENKGEDFVISPSYYLQKKTGGEKISSTLGISEGQYERIDDITDDVPQQYKDEEENTKETVQEEGFEYKRQVVTYQYVFFEIDDGENLADYNLLMEQLFSSEGEETYRATIPL